MKTIKIIGTILAVLVVLLVAALFVANHYLQSPAFKRTVLNSAHDALGSDVTIDKFDVSVFSGITLGGVRIANPQGFAGNLLTADAFVLRYRLLPLLRKRVEIQRLSLDKLVVTLARGAGGAWNYEKVGGAPAPAPSQPAAPSSGTTAPASSLVDVTLSKLAMNHAVIVMLDESGKSLVRFDDANLTCAVNLKGGKLSGTGNTSIETVDVANSLFVRKLSAPVTISADAVKLASLDGTIAAGKISGDAALRLTGGAGYMANVQVKEADLAKLIEEAGVKKKIMTGKLQLTTKLEGTGGLPTIAGNGKAEIVGGQVADIPLLNTLAALLQISALRDLKFSECVLEFSVANNVMQTPVIRLVATDVQITGKGSVSLADYSLNHTMTIEFTTNALAATSKEVRALFTPRQDGTQALDFKVWGPYDAPKTDLTDRLVNAAAQHLIEKGLQKLFKNN